MSNLTSFTGDNFDGTDDVIDSRDITARIETLIEEWEEVTGEDFEISTEDPEEPLEEILRIGLDMGDAEELYALITLRDEAGYVFENEESFIADSYFEEFTEEFCKDVGYLPPELPSWIEIDWSETADNLKADYTSYELRGTTYWARS